MQRDLVTVERFIPTTPARSAQLVAAAGGLKRTIREPTVNRPGLVLTGFTRYFAYKRLQVIGNAEAFYLNLSRQKSGPNGTKPFSLTKYRVLSSPEICIPTNCF